MHWINNYVGLPWVAYARGPEAFDCWGLVLDVLSKHFDIELPQYLGVFTDDAVGMTHAMKSGLELNLAFPVTEPVHGCIACCYLLINGESLLRHVGIYLDIDGGGILNSFEKHQCSFDHPKKMARLFSRIEYLCPRISSLSPTC